MEATLFLSSTANKNAIELICHDPIDQQTSSYQIEANSEVLQMKILTLPSGVRKQSQSHSPQDQPQNNVEVFGILLLLGTLDGISAFSMVFTREENQTSFALDECLELSNSELQDINTPLHGRRVRELQCKIVLGQVPSNATISSSKQQSKTTTTKPFLLLAVASSPEKKSAFTQKSVSSSSHNVDAFLFTLVDHYCPVFRYNRITKPDSIGVPSLAHFQNLMKDITPVKRLEFGGNDLLGKKSHVFLITLLAGELKLVPVPTLMAFQESLNSHTIKVQTTLLSGVCAHPSVANLGEAVLLETFQVPNTSSCNIAVLCRPKIDEIGFKSTSPSDILGVSTRKIVSFSPVQHVSELTPKESNSNSHNGHFFGPGKDTPNLISKIEEDWETPRMAQQQQRQDYLDNGQIVTPDSDHQQMFIDSATPKKSNVSCMSTASSLVGLKLVGNDSMLTTNALPEDDILEEDIKESAQNLSIDTNSTPLEGLDLVSSSRSLLSCSAGTAIEETAPEGGCIDLTRRWSNNILRENSELSALSPLSGLNLNLSPEGELSEKRDHMFLFSATPRQSHSFSQTPMKLQKAQSLKKIQCTTPAREKKVPVAISNDQLSHVIVLKIERVKAQQMGGNDDGNNIHFKVTYSSVPLPSDIASFKSASIKWLVPDNMDAPATLAVATNDPTTNNSRLHTIMLSLSPNGDCNVSEIVTQNMTAIFQGLDRSATPDRKHIYGLRSFALTKNDGALTLGDENSNSFDLRMVISTSYKDDPDKDMRSRIAPKTPINMSLTEDTYVTIASASLPMPSFPTGESKKVDAKAATSADDESSEHLNAKLDEVLSFLQRFESSVNARMDIMDKRLEAIEEAMRTV